MTYTLDGVENASEITITKSGMESLVDREISLEEWEEFCQDWHYLSDVEEAAAQAFERFVMDRPGSPPIP